LAFLLRTLSPLSAPGRHFKVVMPTGHQLFVVLIGYLAAILIALEW
jgi:hypothetical protein